MIIRGIDRKLIAFDFEVFSKADWWCVCFIDYDTKEVVQINNNKEDLKRYYEEHKDDIFIGYNSRGYDIWVLKGILLGENPCKINDEIIEKGKKGYQVVNKKAKDIQFYNFDLSDILHSLKEYEAMMGDMIKESDVPFDLNRPLTNEEIKEVEFYNQWDVKETIKVFDYKKKDFEAQVLLIETFELDMDMFNKTKAQLSAHILGGVKQSRIDDEFDYVLPQNLKLDKYRYVLDWFDNPRNKTYGRKLVTNIAGVEHTLAFGGIHSAIQNYKGEGIYAHADVASLYPSLMIIYDLLSRNVINPKKFKEIKDKRLELKKLKDSKQEALKIVINGTYGISKDRNSSLYDPRQANSICISGQLLNVDLVEKLESTGQLIQNNTDGVIFKFEDEEHLKQAQEIAKEWEERTGLDLEWEIFNKIYQRDVNNYIIINPDGTYESKGCVNEKKGLNYNLPIITKSIIQYCLDGTPIEDYINNENRLIEYQQITKSSSLYMYSYYGTVKQIEHNGKKCTVCDKGYKINEKVNRIFASKDENDKGIFKVKSEFKVEKLANTPDRCFINNDNIHDILVPEKLDKQWYIDLAKKTLSDFLGENDGSKEIKKTKEEQIIEVLNKNHATFYDVLEDIKMNTTITNSILPNYITIDAFKRYGKARKLIDYLNIFKVIYNKKSTRDSSLNKNGIKNKDVTDILKKHSEYKEERGTYSKLDSKQALLEIFDILKNEDLTMDKKILQEFKLYDDCSLKDDNMDSNVLFIMNVNDTHNPSVVAYSLKYGTCNIIKIPKSIFEILPIREKDFIYNKKMERRNKIKVIGKNEKGINLIGKKENEFEWWITQYDIIQRNSNVKEDLEEM